jgi:hypothetical protein
MRYIAALPHRYPMFSSKARNKLLSITKTFMINNKIIYSCKMMIPNLSYKIYILSTEIGGPLSKLGEK